MYSGKHEISVEWWASAVDSGPTLNQCWVNVPLLAGLVIRSFLSMYRSCKQETLFKYWFNIGTASQMMAQQQTNIRSMSCLYGLHIS